MDTNDVSMVAPPTFCNDNFVQTALNNLNIVIPFHPTPAGKIRAYTHDSMRAHIIQQLLLLSKEGKLACGTIRSLSHSLNINECVVSSIWCRIRFCLKNNLPIETESKRKGNCGRPLKRVDLDLLEQLPLKKRKTQRAVGKALGVSKTLVEDF